MKTKLGYYKNKIYQHTPITENQLFQDSLIDYLENNSKITGIEIGVLNGEKSGFLLSISSEMTLYGIDPIIPDSMEASLIGNLETIESNTKKYSNRFHFIQDYSQNVVSNFQDNSIDFVFIDGDHTYNGVKTDFDLYYPKIKKDGLIYFHDSRMYRGGANFHVGSSKFTDELIAHNTMQLIGEAFSLTLFKKTI